MQKVKFSQSLYDKAQQVVDGCMGYESPACQASCPMHTDVKQYVKLAARGKNDQAIKVIRDTLFMPQSLGRICAHPCEYACRRNVEFQQPLSVAGIKRFVAEQADKKEYWDLSVGQDSGKRVVVVGAGPAGAQAAIELRRFGHAVTVIDKLNAYGGMLRVGIPEYRLPRHVIDFEFSYLDMLGVETQFGVEVGKDVAFSKLREQYDAVILAHGAHVGPIIPLPGNDADGVFSAVDYLKEIALTRKFPKAGKRVMVIGGGDVAMDCARSSWRIGVDEVHQCSLETMDTLPASQGEIEQSEQEGVLFNAGWGPREVLSEKGKVVGIVLQKVASIFDSRGNFAPSYADDTRTIACDTVIFATGQTVADITDGQLEQGCGGRYEVDSETLATGLPGVFVAGDASGSSVVIQAMALGRKAALSAQRFLSGKHLRVGRDFEQEYSYSSRLNVPLPKHTEDVPRLNGQLRDPSLRKRDFEQVDLGYLAEQIKQESYRCLQCECRLCMKECIMMNDFGDCPKQLFSDFIDTKSMDPLLAYSCNACDQCTVACPKSYPMKEIFLGARKDFVTANDGNSPMKGHNAINMHQKLGFSKLFTMALKATTSGAK